MANEQIMTVLTETLGRVGGVEPADVTPDATFADLGVDSLTRVDLVVALEDRFGTVTSDDTWETIGTVGDAVAYLERATLLPH